MNNTVEKVGIEWFRSERAVKVFLSTLGLEGKNGRIYRNGIVLSAEFNYGQYSKQAWFVRYPKSS